MPPPDPMKSPVTTFLYVLMRDHLPTGTVKYLIEQAQRAGDPAYSAPELEQLAERYATELLMAPPRDVDEPAPGDDAEGDTGDQAERQPADEPPAAEKAEGGGAPTDDDAGARATDPPPAPPARKREDRAPDAPRVSSKTIDRAREFLRGRDRVKPSELDEPCEMSSSTRARVIRELRAEGFITGIEYEGVQRLLVIRREDGDQAAPPAGDDEPEPDAGEKSSDLPDAQNGSSTPPADPPDADAEDEPPASSGPTDAQLADRFVELLEAADPPGEVWPREVEAILQISQHKRLVLVDRLLSEGRLVKRGGDGPRVRYLSAKSRRPARSAARRGAGEAAEPIGTGPAHLRDSTEDRAKAAKDERDAATIAAAAALPNVREWVKGAGTFGARQLRDTFDLEPAAATLVIASLTKDGAIERVGDPRAGTYSATKATNGNGGGPRGKRPLEAGADGSTLEGRALGALQGDGLSIAGLASRLGVSEDTAKAILGKLYREGDVRPRKRNGELHYAASA